MRREGYAQPAPPGDALTRAPEPRRLACTMNPEMPFPRIAGRYFEAWIANDTWDSYHSLDNERFYRFVKAVARYNRRKPPLPREVSAGIVQRWRGRRVAAELRKTADHFVDLYQTLLAYEATRRFPDPLIERTDIVKYHLELSVRSRNNLGQVERTMADVWGRDWRVKFDRARGVQR